MVIGTEKALDMLPYAVEIIDKIDVTTWKKKFLKENKGKDNPDMTHEAGIELIKHIIKNIGKVKKEVFEIVAIAQESNIDEVKKQSIVITINTFKSIYQDKELVDFFTEALK